MAEKGKLWAFPGLHYFRDDPVDRELFFGRTTEIKELTERILAENITVLFGKSGDGKTSLVNAGLKQAFRDLHYLPVRARIFNTPQEITPLYDAIEREAGANQVQLPENWQKPTLWETFWGLRPTEKNGLKPIVLILDQFEELFTLMAARQDDQEEYICQFADLVRGRVPMEVKKRIRSQLGELKAGSSEALAIEKLLYGSTSSLVTILISLREDYLAFLDNLGKRIPKVYHSRYRLPSLTIEQARQAILNPPQESVLGEQKFYIAEDAGVAIIKFLTVQSSASGITEDMVGPPQLQVLCQKLEEQMRKNHKDGIELADLGGDKGMRKLLSSFYRDITKKFKLLKLGGGPRRLKGLFGLLRRLQPLHSPRLAVRKLCEERLITAGGNRNSRHEDEIVREVGVAKPDLDQLVDSRLLRREPRLQESFYELSHDSLVRSLQTAGGLRKGWVASLRLLMIAAVMVMSWQWGWLKVRNFFEIKSLRSDLEALKEAEFPVEMFKVRLSLAERTVSDSLQFANIQSQYNNWRQQSLADSIASIDSPHLARADSFLNILSLEYPGEYPLRLAMIDTIHLKKLADVERKYQRWVEGLSGEELFAEVESFLDSSYLALDRPTKITELKQDLAGRRGDTAAQRQLAAEAERQRDLVRRQLLAAIRLKEPRGNVVKGDTTGRTMRLPIIMEDHRLFQGARVFLNNNEMSLTPTRKKGYSEWESWIPVSPGDQSVAVDIKVIDKEDNAASKSFRWAVDREPPRVGNVKIQYMNTETNIWQDMPADVWLGESWRIELTATEALEKASVEIELVQQLASLKSIQIQPITEHFSPQSLRGDYVIFEGSIKNRNVDNLRCGLVLRDLAGWVNDVALSEYRLRFRSKPESSLSDEEVTSMIKKYDFYCSEEWPWSNPNGKGIGNDFKLENEGLVVLVRTTGLKWQQSGSAKYKTFSDAQAYIDELNRNRFAGHSNWRLPTLEEAMSLMESERKSGGLYIDSIFKITQDWIWTSDKYDVSAAWYVSFTNGFCSSSDFFNFYVRAVR